MYFLQEGTCRVLQQVELSQQHEDMLTCVDDAVSGGGGIDFGSHRSSVSPRSAPKTRLCEIGTLVPQQYFGERALPAHWPT